MVKIQLNKMLTTFYSHEWNIFLSYGVISFLIFLSFITLIRMPFNWYRDATLLHNLPQKTFNLPNNTLSELIIKIPDAHLLGRTEIDLGDDLPVTSLHLQLIGIMQAVPQNLSRAIIALNNQSGKVYQINDTLLPGVTIYSITNNNIILENNGNFEKLPLQRNLLHFKGMPEPINIST